MTSYDNNFNYCFQNQLTKFSSCLSSLSNKGKQGWQNKFKSQGTNNNLRAKRGDNFLSCCSLNCHIDLKNFPHFGGLNPSVPL